MTEAVAPAPPTGPSRGPLAPAVAVGLGLALVALVIVVVALLVSSGGGSSTAAPAATTTAPAASSAAPTAATASSAPLRVTVVGPSSGPDAAGITASFQQYVNGINSRDLRSAYAVLDQNSQNGGYDGFAAGEATSQIPSFAVLQVTDAGGTDRQAVTRFRSTQAAANGFKGQTCSDWDVVYTMVPGGQSGGWLIGTAMPQEDPRAC